MGALHEGHLSLVREAARRTDEVVVTIFVNPTQFGPGEDFDRYPRMLEADVAAVTSAGARVVFAPPVFEMYPPGEQTRVRVTGLSQGLCGVSRPHHFEGVATIVTKLMNVVGPGVYFFGQKDYQQWKLIEQMARDLLLDVEVVGLPIVRDDDGLAMSSRNAYLSPDERKKALSLSRGLRRAEELFDSGVRSTTDLVDAVRAELSAAGVQGEYIELRGARDLSPVTSDADAPPPPWVIALATTIGKTRLIDNRVLGGESRSLGEWPFGGGGP
jgi:pantoate--beta-alanine ligase